MSAGDMIMNSIGQAQAELRAQATELARVAELTRSAQMGVDTIGPSVENLARELATTNQQVAKLSGNMDMTQEYWKGLTKGLRETHRSIAVENEMLPHRATSMALPALTK